MMMVQNVCLLRGLGSKLRKSDEEKQSISAYPAVLNDIHSVLFSNSESICLIYTYPF